MNKKLLASFSLKWNPFAPDVPTEALYVTPKHQAFGFRVENQIRDGGFAAILGEVGTGKSVALRILANKLSSLRDVTVGVLSRPHCSIPDLYRELGHVFGVSIVPHNRWISSKTLREKWQAHLESVLFRPVLLVDEAQEMRPMVLSELRLLMSKDLDSCSLLTVVLAGDGRLLDKLKLPELVPVGSRIRSRLVTEYANRDELSAALQHLCAEAGNPKLISPELLPVLCEHANGNYRALMNLASELLDAALQKDVSQLDERLFLDVVTPKERPAPKKSQGARAA